MNNSSNQSLIQSQLETINQMLGKSGLNRQIDGRTTPKDLLQVLQAALEQLGAHSDQLSDARKRAEQIDSIESKLDSLAKSFEADRQERKSWRQRQLKHYGQWKRKAQDGPVQDEEVQRQDPGQQEQSKAWPRANEQGPKLWGQNQRQLERQQKRTERQLARANALQLQGIGELDTDKPLFAQRRERWQKRTERQTSPLAEKANLDSDKPLFAQRQERRQRRELNRQTSPLAEKANLVEGAETEVQVPKCCNAHPLLLASAKPEHYQGGVECDRCSRQVRVKLGFYRCASGCNYDVCKRCFNQEFREARRALAKSGRRRGWWMQKKALGGHVDAEVPEPEEGSRAHPELPEREDALENPANQRGAKGDNPWRLNANRRWFHALGSNACKDVHHDSFGKAKYGESVPLHPQSEERVWVRDSSAVMHTDEHCVKGLVARPRKEVEGFCLRGCRKCFIRK